MNYKDSVFYQIWPALLLIAIGSMGLAQTLSEANHIPHIVLLVAGLGCIGVYLFRILKLWLNS